MTELRETLADSFCNDRRLANLEKRFHDEVLEPHGGLSVVMTREPSFLNEVFQKTLFQRVACTVDEWLKNSDAASILYQWYGSIEGVVEKLIQTGKVDPPRPAQEYGRAAHRRPAGKSLGQEFAGKPGEVGERAFHLRLGVDSG